MIRLRYGALAVGTVLLLSLFLVGGSSGLLAQDAGTPAAEEPAAAGRPVHIHTGNCAEGELGDVVFPLENVTLAEGEAQGQAGAAAVETSVSTVAVALADILAADHAINVHLSQEEIGTYIACGEIGGVALVDGAIVIGLREQNDSGFTGIAYLAPGADGASTNVSLFLAEGLGSAAAGGEDAGAAETPAAEGTPEAAAEETPAADETPTATGNPVEVTLSEFAIDMETTIPAGATSFLIDNTGDLVHGFEIEGVEEATVEYVLPESSGGTGEPTILNVDLAPGTYTVYCPVGNHRTAQGMEIELTVE